MRNEHSKILLLCIFFFITACNEKDSELSNALSDSCAQHPFTWYKEELRTKNVTGKNLYVFGPRDSEFRKEVKAVIDNFIQTGKDIYGEEKISLVEKYLPKYMASCKEFYSGMIEKCKEYFHNGQKNEFQSCAQPYDKEYFSLLNFWFSSHVSKSDNNKFKKQESLNLENININELKKLYRKNLVHQNL